MAKSRIQDTWGAFRMHTDDEEEHYLTIDDNRLLFDGKPIVTEQKITLGWWVNIAIVIASIATAATAFVTVIALWPW